MIQTMIQMIQVKVIQETISELVKLVNKTKTLVDLRVVMEPLQVKSKKT
jgi:hypothetical protein